MRAGDEALFDAWRAVEQLPNELYKLLVQDNLKRRQPNLSLQRRPVEAQVNVGARASALDDAVAGLWVAQVLVHAQRT